MYKIPLVVTNSERPIAGQLLILLLLLLNLPLASAAQSPHEADLGSTLETLRVDNNVAAFGLVVVRDDQVALLLTRGLADRASEREISNDAIFRIGSISKLFTGLLAASLEQEGELSLDEPVRRWPIADTYSNPWFESAPITTAQLLEHTAGFTDFSQPEWDYSDPGQRPLNETLRLYPAARTAQWRPGQHYSYSNAGAGVAGHIMELATDEPYEALLRDRLLEPMGLASTSVFPPDLAKLPTGYDRDGVSPIPYWHQIFRPAAAINSSLADMARLLRTLLNRGQIDGKRILSEETIARTETPTTSLAARQGLRHGYGLGNYSWHRNGVEWRGHGGDADGYLSRLGYTRSNNSGYFMVITAFQPKTLKQMTAAVETFLLAGVNRPADFPQMAQATASLEALCGNYRSVSYRFGPKVQTDGEADLRIFTAADTLHYQRPGKHAIPLLPVAPHLFRRQKQGWPGVFIGPGDDGEIYFQSGSDNFMRLPTKASGEESMCRRAG